MREIHVKYDLHHKSGFTVCPGGMSRLFRQKQTNSRVGMELFFYPDSRLFSKKRC
jgi:hypothetical protein